MSSYKQPQNKNLIEIRVVEFMKSSFPDYPCTSADIRNPKKEFVVGFFSFILEQLRMIVPDIIQKPIEKQLEEDSYPEVCRDMLLHVNFTHILQVILAKINTSGFQFGLDDIIEPKPARNTIFMFGLLNFYNFADNRVSMLHEKLDVLTTRKLEMEELLEKRDTLSKEINLRAVKKGKRHDYAREMKAKKSEMEDIARESKSLDVLCEKKQTELEDIRRRVARVQSEISEMEKSLLQLESNQVQSPDALKSNHQHLIQKLEETKQQLQQSQETNKEKKNYIQLLEKLQKDLVLRQAILTDIVREKKAVMELESQLSDIHPKIPLGMKENETLLSQITGLKTKFNSIVEQVTNLKLQWDKTKRGLQESIRHLKKEKDLFNQQQNSKMGSILASLEKYKEEYADLLELNNKNNERYQELYAKLNQKEQDFINGKLEELKLKNKELDERAGR